MAELFLSHSSSDVDAVRRLRRHLEAGGYSCWMAPDDVSSAESWAQQIVDAIQNARVTVVLLSERSIASEHVAREVGLAVQAGKPVLPVRLERVMLSGTLAYLLHLTQWVDAFPGTIDSHINDIGGRVADLVGARSHEAPFQAAAPRPPSDRPSARSETRRDAAPRSSLGIVAGGLAVATGSVLPWMEATAGPVVRSWNGIDREGVGAITLVLGVILVVLGIVSAARGSRVAAVLALIVAVVAGLMGAVEAIHQRDLDVLQEGVSLSLGFGLPVLIGGAAVAGLAAAVALVRGRPSFG
jgi:hypothetical protein